MPFLDVKGKVDTVGELETCFIVNVPVCWAEILVRWMFFFGQAACY